MMAAPETVRLRANVAQTYSRQGLVRWGEAMARINCRGRVPYPRREAAVTSVPPPPDLSLSSA